MSHNLLFMAAAVLPNEGLYQHTCQYMIQSCKEYGIDLSIYGLNTPEYPGWVKIKLEIPLHYLKQHTEDYVLYTDAWDAFFTGSAEEIWQKYEELGRPDFMAAAARHMFPHEADTSLYDASLGEYRYPHVGGYIGKRDYIIALFETMLSHAENLGDDANIWYNGKREGWFNPAVDNTCQIFQLEDNEDLTIKNNRLFNERTQQFPCVFHMPGGSSDAQQGKLAAIKPWWDKIKGA